MDIFDWKFYLDFYSDLVINGIDSKEEAYKHYIYYGKNEFRYKNKNEFLKKNNFNSNIYRYNYDDLKDLNEINLINHYIYHGFYENRNPSSYMNKIIDGNVFILNFYMENNEDLKNLNDLELLNHYINIGKNESRICSFKVYDKSNMNLLIEKKYNPDKYKKKYKDLENFSNLELEEHFINHGINEGRNCIIENLPNKIKKYDKKINYKIKKTVIIDSKEKHRRECINNLDLIRKIKQKKEKTNYFYETVMIEFRIFPHLEFLIRKIVLSFPSWRHTVICGNTNFNSLKNIIYMINININVKINLIKLDIENIKPSEYSKLITNIDFYNHFEGEKLLFYQEDSLIFHNKIEKYLKYDYIGAPWPEKQNDNLKGVGNGGFSLRSKTKILECLNTIKPKDLEISESTLEYMRNTKSNIIPEDVYFSKTMINYKIGLVADRNIAKEFSQETQLAIDPLGGHNWWLADTSTKLYINTFKLIDNYYMNVTHRGGWKSIIQNSISNNIINNNGNIILVDCCESYFLWEDREIIQSDWVGVVHFCYNLPEFLNNENIKILLNKENFKKSLKYCKSIIVLSNYLKNSLSHILNVNLKFIKHPILEIKSKFNINNFLKKKKYYFILLGFQSRKISDFFLINSKFKKLCLPGRKNMTKKYIIDRFNLEKKELNFKKKIRESDINIYYSSHHDKYDNILKNNILIVPLWDASANNSILEIIEMNIPTFITRMESTIEYLGEDYPMFYNNYTEIEYIINNRTLLENMYKKTHKYLCNLNKNDLRIEHFNSEMLKIINF